jgi:DNA-binding Xre family transcriptional regulator
MTNYKKVSFYVDEDIYNEIDKIIQYRNSRVLALDLDKKSRTVEDFAKGCFIHYLKALRTQEELAGIDDLGKPFRLRNHFKEIVQKKGWTQKQLAEATNIDPSNISITLSNRSQPSLDYFLRIWIALGCPPLTECLSRIKD